MTAQVRCLQEPGSAGHPPRASAPSLRASRELWLAPDLDAVVEAAGDLLAEVVPGTKFVRCSLRESARLAAGTTDPTVRIALPQREVLFARAPDGPDRAAALAAAGEMIAARIDELGRHTALSGFVEQVARSERLQHALYAIADQASIAGTDLTAMFKALHAIVGTLMYAENFYIAQYDVRHDSVWFPYFADSIDHGPAFPTPGKPLPVSGTHPAWSMSEIVRGPTWYVIHDRKPLMGSLESLSRQVSGPFKVTGAMCNDWLGVPLLHGDDVAGCVVVQSYDDVHHYDEDDKALLIFMAQHIQTAMERRLAHAELERRVEERTEALSQANEGLQREVHERQRGERLQAALFRIAELASSTESIDAFYAAVHRVVGDLLYARNFYISLLSDDDAELTFPYWVDERSDPGEWAPRHRSASLTDYVIARGEALLADAAELAKLHAEDKVQQGGTGAQCWLGVPLVCAERTVGVLVVQSYSSEHHYTAHDQELLTFVSYHIANALERVRAAESLRQAYSGLERRVDERTHELAVANGDLRSQITERERIEARLKYETLHDSLTGLPNRSLLMQRLEQALARYRADPGSGFAVLFMDLDRFKVINDSEGHLVGDDLLVQVGRRIRGNLKNEDVVARLGGDEFAVLLEGAGDEKVVDRIAQRILGNLNTPFRLAARELFTSASIGIALAAPHYRDPEELLRDADSAMYQAKSEGRHRCALFDDDLRCEAVSRLTLENDLRRGLTHREFVPYYQPIVDIEADRVIGYEALMRWRHPQRGILLPGEFLGVAEETGASETIDWQVFEQVCRDANALAGSHGAFVAINLSARHFSNPRLDGRLLELLATYGVPPSRLHVEVTERTLVENTPVVKRILEAFRSAGISISLDDFGTGYSSLAYLQQYPLQILKIDRSFIANLTAGEGSGDAVIRAILAMARTLSIQVIAEGVETPLQRDLLSRLGCRHVQGFLYAKAQPVDTWLGNAGHPGSAAPRIDPVATTAQAPVAG